MLLWILALLSALLMPLSAFSAQPSFDCDKARSSAEKAVCASGNLAALDRETARLYKLALTGEHADAESAAHLKAFQRGWIKGRDDCWKDGAGLKACVAASYVLRIHELRENYAAARGQDSDGISIGPLAYACDGLEAGLSAAFVNTPDTRYASLKWRQNAVVLVQAVSASGARYTSDLYGESIEFWVKRQEAVFALPDREPLSCRVDSTG